MRTLHAGDVAISALKHAAYFGCQNTYGVRKPCLRLYGNKAEAWLQHSKREAGYKTIVIAIKHPFLSKRSLLAKANPLSELIRFNPCTI